MSYTAWENPDAYRGRVADGLWMPLQCPFDAHAMCPCRINQKGKHPCTLRRVMASEYGSLQALLKRKRHSVSRAALYWLYFKRHLLEKEDIRTLFQGQPCLSKVDFRELLFSTRDCHPQRHGPRFCRVSKEDTRAKNIRELISITYQYYLSLLAPTSILEVRNSTITRAGLGVFLKENHQLSRNEGLLASTLFGFPLELSKGDYDELLESGYPSILRGYRKRFIIIGPLSLVNHSCRAPLQFSLAESPVDMAEEFLGMPTVQLTARKELSILRGSEVFVDYFGGTAKREGSQVFGDICACKSCDEKRADLIRRE